MLSRNRTRTFRCCQGHSRLTSSKCLRRISGGSPCCAHYNTADHHSTPTVLKIFFLLIAHPSNGAGHGMMIVKYLLASAPIRSRGRAHLVYYSGCSYLTLTEDRAQAHEERREPNAFIHTKPLIFILMSLYF